MQDAEFVLIFWYNSPRVLTHRPNLLVSILLWVAAVNDPLFDFNDTTSRWRIQFQTFIAENENALLGYSANFVGHDRLSDRDDLLQDACLRFIRTYRDKSFHDITNPLGLMCRCIRTAAIDRSRKKDDTLTGTEATASALLNYAFQDLNAASDFDLLDELTRCLNKLQSPLREVVDRFFFKGTKQREIAADMGVSNATISKRKNVAIHHLRECLSRLYGESLT